MKISTATLLIFLTVTVPGLGQTNSKYLRLTYSSTYSDLSEGYFVGSDNVRLFYRKIGRATNTVICVHGGPGLNIASGCLDVDPLAKGRTVIMYDQRGSGRSELISDPKHLTVNDHLRDLEALRQYFGIEHFALIGFSWGAGLAALYATAHPERVERLLLVAPLPPAKTPFWQQRLEKLNAKLGSDVVTRINQIRQRLPQATDEETLALCREMRLGYRAYLANPGNISRVRDRCLASPASIRNGIIVSRATLESLGDWDFRPQLARLTMPTLVIEGAETEVPLEATREWTNTIPSARLLLIPNSGHELWAEKPATFLKAAERFLRGKYPSQSEIVRKSR